MSTRLEAELTHSPVIEFVGRWHQGERKSAREFLAQHPELSRKKSVVLNLALEEYCLRRDSGETILPSTFCDQFPRYRKSLQRMLFVRGYIDEGGCGVKSLADADFHWPEVGDTFLGFELLAELGKGAFAQVFLARQDDLGGRLVALKVAFYGAGEAKTLGRLPHANIVPVFSISTDETGQLTAVCMPFLGRATLCDLLDVVYSGEGWPASAEVISRVANDRSEAAEHDNAPRADETTSDPRSYVEGVVDLIRQLAEALVFIHGKGYLHRDLKPSNVLLAQGGVPMLLDFNLSVGVDRESKAVCGTVTYLPPELLRRLLDDHQVDADAGDRRTDIFSLGVMFYELLTGSLPFGNPESNLSNEEAAQQLLDRQALGVPVASNRNPQVSPELERILARCLAIDPANRYANVGELLTDLAGIGAPPTPRIQLAPRRTVLWGAGVLVVLGAIGGTYWAIGDGSGVGNPDAGERRVSFEAPAVSQEGHVPPVPKAASLEEALLEYERGEWRAALAIFDRCLEQQPQDAQTLFAVGQVYRQLGDLDAAERYYERAVQYSEAGEIRACLGYCLGKRNRISQGAAELEKAISAGHRDSTMLNNLGFLLLKLGRFEEAQSYLDQTLSRDDKCYAAWHNRAMLANRIAQKNQTAPSMQSLQDFEQALAIGKKTTQIYADGAALYAAATKQNPELREKSLEYLALALKSGLPPQQAKANPACLLIGDAESISSFLSLSGQPVSPTSAELLIPPSAYARLKSF